MLRYQSGMLLETPSSENNFLYQLGVGSQDNPAVFGAPEGLENYVPGQPFFSVNPNSHFDPTKTLVLNPKAWTDAPAATYGVSAPYYINNRWQRQPAESLSVGRNFRIKEKYQLPGPGGVPEPVQSRVLLRYRLLATGTGAYTPAAYNNPFPVLGRPAERCREAMASSTSLTAVGRAPTASPPDSIQHNPERARLWRALRSEDSAGTLLNDGPRRATCEACLFGAHSAGRAL